MNRITKSFGKKLILNDIEFNINSCTLILGENGSGKTTLFKILSGLIKKYSGEIETNDNVSVLLDLPCFYLFQTGYSNLEYFLNKDELKKAEKYIEYFEMDSYINNLVKSYSNGMKKKLALVLAFSRNKEYLLLDEPTNSLDNQSIELLKELLIKEKENKKIFIASHDIKIFDNNLIEQIILLKKTKIYSIDVSSLDFIYYKIKTINAIFSSNYSFKVIDDYFVFKIFKNEIIEFSNWVSQYKLLEMIKLDLCDPLYLEDFYND